MGIGGRCGSRQSPADREEGRTRSTLLALLLTSSHLPWGSMEPEPSWKSRAPPGHDTDLEASSGRMASKERLYELWLLYFTKVSDCGPRGPRFVHRQELQEVSDTPGTTPSPL